MKKTQTHDEHAELVDAFSEFKELKNIDRASMMSILEDVFKNMIKKKFGSADNFDIVINTDKGDLEAFRNRLIVEDEAVEDSSLQIGYSEAIQIEPDFEIGEEVSEKIRFSDFGRRAVLAARQNLTARVQELEKEGIFRKYKDRVGEIITGEVYQTWKKETLVMDDDGNELILPKVEQIPSDFFKKGDSVRAVVLRVEMINGTPKIILSRTSPLFLEKLFELEVPEVFDGLITIKKIVREPGERAKVAVESYDDRIDPVGACVGMKGSRIHGIVRELRNENIDVINFTSNIPLFISRSLAPAKITTIKLDDEKKRASVFLKPDQVSLAIGKGGNNIKLAGRLTGYEIDVYRDTDDDTEDVDLDEFSDEIEPWIIDELKAIGCDTAKSVLELPVEDLVKRTDLEEETIKEVIRILRAEFE
ncbi:MAG: transcription termination/antitermination protein NusA [Bacteroidetes bacterium]|nr:MAG: transcription termination/antitermination protein NusA [Bacteroidota bacterium]REK36289.1 MAG: transcription termination/antitermination protein NusA [Bacteroidota bacterium]REK51047.1 MAG: transcription termination/antitermination protein NusA [Bacteroidota bacterium]